MKRLFLLLIAFLIAFCPFITVYAAVETPPNDYSLVFRNKVFPSDKLLSYYWIFYNPDSSNYRLLTSDSPFYFKYDSSQSLFELFSASTFYRYNSSDFQSWSVVSSSLLLDSSVCSLNNLSTGNFIYYTNADILFYYANGDLISNFSGYTESDGKFLQYYDYYNDTNYSGLNPHTDSGWNFGDLFGGISSVISSGFNSVTNFFTNFWNGLSGALTALFIPSESGMQRIKTQLENKFDFVSSFTTAFAVFNNTEGQSLNYQFTWLDGKQYSIDFSWYAPYRLMIRSLSGALFYFLGFWKCFKMISSVVRINVGGDGN